MGCSAPSGVNHLLLSLGRLERPRVRTPAGGGRGPARTEGVEAPIHLSARRAARPLRRRNRVPSNSVWIGTASSSGFQNTIHVTVGTASGRPVRKPLHTGGLTETWKTVENPTTW